MKNEKNNVVCLNDMVIKKYKTEKLPEHIATLEENITLIKERVREYQTTLVKMEENLRTLKEELPK